MNSKRQKLVGDLYKIGRRAYFIAPGFAISTPNDACLEIQENELKSTRFGIYLAGPELVASARQDREDGTIDKYDSFVTDIPISVYSTSSDYYIPTVVTHMPTWDEFAVYDTQDGLVYKVNRDKRDSEVYNLISVDEKTIKKIQRETIHTEIEDRFLPLTIVNDRKK